MAVRLRRLIFLDRRYKVPPGKIHLYRRSFKRSSRGKIEDISSITSNLKAVSFTDSTYANFIGLMGGIGPIKRICLQSNVELAFTTKALETYSGTSTTSSTIINLGLSPKISNVDDVALTVMWPSTLMRILYLSPSTTLCLQIDSHHARERGGKGGTRRTTKEGGGRQSGGGSGPVEAAAAVIAPSRLPDVARGEAADLGGCRATARRRRQRRGKATGTVPPPLRPTTFLSMLGQPDPACPIATGAQGRPNPASPLPTGAWGRPDPGVVVEEAGHRGRWLWWRPGVAGGFHKDAVAASTTVFLVGF
uniref:Uncharacterized protein n=2 Tax=Oryza sativa subsp. japonica TaxID=39947 RepID=Q8S5I3_ORYSJ|nr:Hypothetical protein [Oryza sativa Japonica Group]AAP52355.1 hypothetical protein LOC_Os10g09170 [Oryza sativa Japonica Group]